jgi:aminomethyltransferase
MVPFAGYDMPVHYPAGILREHLHTREHAGLFDVSHMGQVLVRGPGAAEALEGLMPVDLLALPVGRQVYSLLTLPDGGVLDDLMVYRRGPEAFLLVLNAACKVADLAHLRAALPRLEVQELADRALLALQGPAAARLLAPFATGLGELRFMQGRALAVAGIDCLVTRSGYTGEDGFEISLPKEAAEGFARRLLSVQGIAPVGLGARDSLRLEAGLCLYGHELSPDISPIEAGLGWAIAPARRPGAARAGAYPGADRIGRELLHGASRRRVGLRGRDKAPVRDGAALLDATGREVGRVSSGGFAPSLGAPVAMALVAAASAAEGTGLQAIVRDRPRPMDVVRMPFVPTRYYRG